MKKFKMTIGAIIFFFIGGFLYTVLEVTPHVKFNRPIVSFCAIGDTGTGDEHQKRVAQVINEDKECDAILFLGDLFYPSGAETIEQFNRDLVNMYPNHELFLVGGNHDTYDLALRFKKINNVVEWSKPHKRIIYPHYHYSIKTINDICFLAIETTVYTNLFMSKFEKNQNEWLEKFDRSACKRLIVFTHHPYKSSGDHGDAKGRTRKMWEFVIDKLEPDYILSGHDHNLSYEGVFNQSKAIVSGSGAKLRSCKRNEQGPDNGVRCFLKRGYVRIYPFVKKHQFVFVD